MSRSCRLCDRRHYGRGLCKFHHERQWHGRDLNAPKRGTIVKYCGAHRRIHKLWGPARDYSCCECGKQAANWAYDGQDSSELTAEDKGGAKYSMNPEFYKPLCMSCHKLEDLARGAAA